MVSFNFIIDSLQTKIKVEDARLKTCRNLLDTSNHHIELMRIYSAVGLNCDFYKELDLVDTAHAAIKEILDGIEPKEMEEVEE